MRVRREWWRYLKEERREGRVVEEGHDAGLSRRWGVVSRWREGKEKKDDWRSDRGRCWRGRTVWVGSGEEKRREGRKEGGRVVQA